MAQITQNFDQTFTIMLSVVEYALLTRWSRTFANNLPEQQLAIVVNTLLQDRITDYRAQDARTLKAAYDSLSPDQQTAVDTLLGTKFSQP